MITRWEIRENTVTSGSVYILAIIGDSEGVAALEKELYFFCRFVDVKLPPFTHVFELVNVSDEGMLEKIRIKIEECVHNASGENSSVFSTEDSQKGLNLDVISPETQIFPQDSFKQAVSTPAQQEPDPYSGLSPLNAVDARDRAKAAPQEEHEEVQSLHIAEATRYEEMPSSPKTESKLSLAKSGLSVSKESDAFEGGIQIDNELDVGDGTFINLDSASSKQLSEKTDFNPAEGLSGLLKDVKMNPLGGEPSKSSAPATGSSSNVDLVAPVSKVETGGLLSKIFKRFGSSKETKRVAPMLKPAAPTALKPAAPQVRPQAPHIPPAPPQIAEHAPNPFDSLNKKPQEPEHSVVVRQDEPAPEVLPEKPEVEYPSGFTMSAGNKNMQGPLAEQKTSSLTNAEKAVKVDDIFAAETICDFYANPEEQFKPSSAQETKSAVEQIIAQQPSKAENLSDDLSNVPNLLGPSSTKAPQKEEESPLEDLLSPQKPTSPFENKQPEVKKTSWKTEEPKIPAPQPLKVSSEKQNNIVLTRASVQADITAQKDASVNATKSIPQKTVEKEEISAVKSAPAVHSVIAKETRPLKAETKKESAVHIGQTTSIKPVNIFGSQPKRENKPTFKKSPAQIIKKPAAPAQANGPKPSVILNKVAHTAADKSAAALKFKKAAVPNRPLPPPPPNLAKGTVIRKQKILQKQPKTIPDKGDKGNYFKQGQINNKIHKGESGEKKMIQEDNKKNQNIAKPQIPEIKRPASPRPSAPLNPQRTVAPQMPRIQRPLPPPAPRPAQPSVPSAAEKAEQIAPVPDKTAAIDRTLQIPIGQIYKKSNWPLEIPLVPTFTFENMDLASNRFPHASAMSVIENLGTMHNPFVLYGESGTGKTHFLNAIAYEISKRLSPEKVFITNGVRLGRGVQRYVEEGKMKSLDDIFRQTEVLIIDDIHLTAVNENNKEFISKLLNTFLKNRKQIVISSKYPPESLERFEDLVGFRLDQGWISELKPPRVQHFAKIYNKMVQDAEIGISEAKAQSFFGTSGYNLCEIARYIRNAKVLYRRIKDSNSPEKGYEEILNLMLASAGEDQSSEIFKKSFEDIQSIHRGENTDWGNFGFFFPHEASDKFKWIAFSTIQRAKELGIKGGFNFALKSSYTSEHIISAAFKIANICDNKNLKGAIILGPSSVSCTPAIRDNFYDILVHMLEIMSIRCGIIDSEGIKMPSSYVKVLGDVLK